MLTATLFLILNHSKSSTGAPLPANEAGAQTVSWVSDPNGRGTVSLVESCVLTLSLCVWSAIHLNIPRNGETTLSRRFRDFRWIVTGILAPELVVFAAWRQWSSSKALLEELNGLSDNSPISKDEESQLHASSSFQPRRPWHMTQSFFAGMGGLSFELEDAQNEGSSNFLPKDCQSLTLTPRGVLLLAKCGHLPEISHADIDDKSKADGIAKALVCVQAIWMIIQVIDRAASNLPVTLLEVNTIGHVLCALFVYAVWWNKPREVKEPIRLRGEWVRPLMAYFYVSSRISGKLVLQKKLLHRRRANPELSIMACCPPKSLSCNSSLSKDASTSATLTETPTECTVFDEDLSANDLLHGSLQLIPTVAPQIAGVIPSQQAARTSLVIQAISLYPCIRSRFVPRETFTAQLSRSCDRQYKPITEELLVRRASNWPTEALLSRTGGLIIGMVLWFVSIGFGAVHACAWNGFFPTTIERLLWRASGLFISGSGALWLMINLLAHQYKGIDQYWEKVLNNEASWFSYAILGITCAVCGFLYVFARLFLVVEAFISIRELPVSAYETPSWTNLIPHL